MHYSFIITKRVGQIDLHFEPTPVFSDFSSRKYFIPQINSEINNDGDSILFPYRIGSFKEMVNEFKCIEYCFRNLALVVVRSKSSNSARQDTNYYGALEKALTQEIKEMGFNTVIIDSEEITNFRINLNSIMNNGLNTTN